MEVKKEKGGSLSPVRSALKRDSGDDSRGSRSSSKSEKELRLPPEKPSDDSLRRERRLSKNSDSSRDTFERQDSKSTSLTSPKVSRKYFTNWRQACDKTKDKTKELLKRWRTLPESEVGEDQMQAPGQSDEDKHHGWSVHVWRMSRTEINTVSRDKHRTVPHGVSRQFFPMESIETVSRSRMGYSKEFLNKNAKEANGNKKLRRDLCEWCNSQEHESKILSRGRFIEQYLLSIPQGDIQELKKPKREVHWRSSCGKYSGTIREEDDEHSTENSKECSCGKLIQEEDTQKLVSRRRTERQSEEGREGFLERKRVEGEYRSKDKRKTRHEACNCDCKVCGRKNLMAGFSEPTGENFIYKGWLCHQRPPYHKMRKKYSNRQTIGNGDKVANHNLKEGNQKTIKENPFDNTRNSEITHKLSENYASQQTIKLTSKENQLLAADQDFKNESRQTGTKTKQLPVNSSEEMVAIKRKHCKKRCDCDNTKDDFVIPNVDGKTATITDHLLRKSYNHKSKSRSNRLSTNDFERMPNTELDPKRCRRQPYCSNNCPLNIQPNSPLSDKNHEATDYQGSRNNNSRRHIILEQPLAYDETDQTDMSDEELKCCTGYNMRPNIDRELSQTAVIKRGSRENDEYDEPMLEDYQMPFARSFERCNSYCLCRPNSMRDVLPSFKNLKGDVGAVRGSKINQTRIGDVYIPISQNWNEGPEIHRRIDIPNTERERRLSNKAAANRGSTRSYIKYYRQPNIEDVQFPVPENLSVDRSQRFCCQSNEYPPSPETDSSQSNDNWEKSTAAYKTSKRQSRNQENQIQVSKYWKGSSDSDEDLETCTREYDCHHSNTRLEPVQSDEDWETTTTAKHRNNHCEKEYCKYQSNIQPYRRLSDEDYERIFTDARKIQLLCKKILSSPKQRKL